MVRGQAIARRTRAAAQAARTDLLGDTAVHYFVTGRVFAVRGGPQKISQVQHEQIATLGRVATVREDDPGPRRFSPSRLGRFRDESASGLRLARVDASAKSRLMLGQLLGIRLATRRLFFSAPSNGFRSRWNSNCAPASTYSPAFPREPRSGRSAAKPQPSNTPRPSCCRRSLRSRAPETLVVPAGWFKPNREIECSQSAPESCDLLRSSIAAPISSASRSRRSDAPRPRPAPAPSSANFSHPTRSFARRL